MCSICSNIKREAHGPVQKYYWLSKINQEDQAIFNSKAQTKTKLIVKKVLALIRPNLILFMDSGSDINMSSFF